MGIYAEYLDQQTNFAGLITERKKQLSRISQLRDGNDVFCYASDFPRKQTPRVSIEYPDLMCVQDQLSNLNGGAVDVILETPGGSAEVAEDIVKMLRNRYKKVSFVVPGVAKSAGTIMVMSGDEILMGPMSALGPIDAQMFWQGRMFSAEAFLEGLEVIKNETVKDGALNRAYIPILGNISPGEIQGSKNALAFSKTLVSNWLVNFKFKNWTIHSRTNAPVLPTERQTRADEIASALCDHKRWLSHSRSIKIADLESVGLRIVDYSKTPDLFDAIQRYYTLMQMTFEMTNIYKIFETPQSQIYRFLVPQGPQPVLQQPTGLVAVTEFTCPNCQTKSRIQANFDKNIPLEPGAHLFPRDDQFECPNCKAKSDLKALRFQLESQTKRRILS